jgi:hypothetical protein
LFDGFDEDDDDVAVDDDVVPNLRRPCDGVVDVCIELRLHFLSFDNADSEDISLELLLLLLFELEPDVFICCFNLFNSC